MHPISAPESFSITPHRSPISPLHIPHMPDPPRLAAGIESAVFHTDPIFLRDPASGEYNFDSRFESIPSIADFDFSKLPGFIPASKDKRLHDIGHQSGAKFIASTSSITTVLTKIIIAINCMRPVSLARLSDRFNKSNHNFVRSVTDPTSILIKYRDGIYAIDALKLPQAESQTINVLSELGRLLEKKFCVDPEEFETFLKPKNQPPSDSSVTAETVSDASKPDIEKKEGDSLFPDAYHFSTCGDFMLRAQLDCYHPDLPRRTFDLKTRATLPIRMDAENYRNNIDYEIRTFEGMYQSFEREYYDILRSPLIKYGLQARIGNMDGIFVCYHNTNKVFGFQYLPLQMIDEDIYGSTEFAEQLFSLSIQILGRILNQAIEKYPKCDLRITFLPHKDSRLACYIQPAAHKSTYKADQDADGSASSQNQKEESDDKLNVDKNEFGSNDPLDPNVWHPDDAILMSIEMSSTTNSIEQPFILSANTHPIAYDDEWRLTSSVTTQSVRPDRCNQVIAGLVRRAVERRGNTDYVNQIRKLSNLDPIVSRDEAELISEIDIDAIEADADKIDI